MKSLVDNESFEFSEGVTPEELEDHESTRCGEYTGDGNSSQSINLGKKPKAVIIAKGGFAMGYETNYQNINGGIIYDGHPLVFSTATLGTVTSTGFTVNNVDSDLTLNANTETYRYIAFFN